MSSVNLVFCTACGSKIPEDSQFCRSCGAKQWLEEVADIEEEVDEEDEEEDFAIVEEEEKYIGPDYTATKEPVVIPAPVSRPPRKAPPVRPPRIRASPLPNNFGKSPKTTSPKASPLPNNFGKSSKPYYPKASPLPNNFGESPKSYSPKVSPLPNDFGGPPKVSSSPKPSPFPSNFGLPRSSPKPIRNKIPPRSVQPQQSFSAPTNNNNVTLAESTTPEISYDNTTTHTEIVPYSTSASPPRSSAPSSGALGKIGHGITAGSNWRDRITKKKILAEAKKGFFGPGYVPPEEETRVSQRELAEARAIDRDSESSLKGGFGKLRQKSKCAIKSTKIATQGKNPVSNRNLKGLFRKNNLAIENTSSSTDAPASTPATTSAAVPVTVKPKPFADKPAQVHNPAPVVLAPEATNGGWEEWTTEEGYKYYYHPETKVSSWEKPAEFGQMAPAPQVVAEVPISTAMVVVPVQKQITPAPKKIKPAGITTATIDNRVPEEQEVSSTSAPLRTAKTTDEKLYAKQKRKEALERRRFGPKIQSLYQHQCVTSAVCTFLLVDSREQTKGTRKFTTYELQILWKGVCWTIFRRFQQFWDWNRTIKHQTKILVRAQLPNKKMFKKRSAENILKRKRGLECYLAGITKQQLEFLNDPFYEQLLIRFFGPLQIGDIKPKDQALPFKVQLL